VAEVREADAGLNASAVCLLAYAQPGLFPAHLMPRAPSPHAQEVEVADLMSLNPSLNSSNGAINLGEWIGVAYLCG